MKGCDLRFITTESDVGKKGHIPKAHSGVTGRLWLQRSPGTYEMYYPRNQSSRI